MRKLLLLALPVFALGSFGVAQASHRQAVAKTPVCHQVGSKYHRVIALGSKQLKGFTANAADIIPAPAACPKVMLSPTSSGKGITSITVSMLGVSEQPDPADPDGKGTATFRLRQGEGQICYSLSVSNIGAANGAHIHQGPFDASGPVYVPLTTPECVRVVERVREGQLAADRRRHAQEPECLLRERAHSRLPERRDPRAAPAADERVDPDGRTDVR